MVEGKILDLEILGKPLFNFQISMIKYFKTFFYPNTYTYTYNQSKEIVLARIDEILNRKTTFLSSNDVKGRFLNNDRLLYFE